MAETSATSTANETRQPLTILFTDVVGSSAYFAERGDTAGVALIERHNRLLMPILTRAGGRVIKTIGDSIFATFGNPGQAVRAAWSMQQRLADANSQMDPGDQIRIRIGVHYGLVFEKKGDVFGDAVNMAERVKSKANAGQIVLSRTVRDLLRADPSIQVRSLGPVDLKGSPEPVEIFELTSAPAPADAPANTMRVYLAAGALACLLVVAGGFFLWRQSAAGSGPQPAAPPASALEAVSTMALVLGDAGQSAELQNPESAALHSGDKFQILYRPLAAHFLYAAFYDATAQEFTLVFPAQDTLQPLQAGERVLIPRENVRFTLDDQPRTETVLLIFSAQRVEALEQVVRGGSGSGTMLRDALQQIKSAPAAQARFEANTPPTIRVVAPMGGRVAWAELHIRHR